MGAITFKKLSGSGGATGVEITYAELKELRDSGKLVVGTEYVITDYECTTTTPNTRSGGHNFDIIVVADSPNTLNEEARARKHEGDTYFENSNLSAWQLKYSLDNDVTRFNWADEVNGKGVIYYMKDEWENEVPYDFKNIVYQVKAGFKALKYGMEVEFGRATSNDVVISGVQYYAYYTNGGGPVSSGIYYVTDNPITTSSQVYNSAFNIEGSMTINSFSTLEYDYYTFNTNDNTDDSINGICKFNKIEICIAHSPTRPIKLNNNSFGMSCSSNKLGYGCSDNSFGNNCVATILMDECSKNVLENDCNDNIFGKNSIENFLESECGQNKFGSNSYNNKLIGGSRNNILGNDCSNTTLEYSHRVEMKNVNNIKINSQNFVDTSDCSIIVETLAGGKVIAHWVNDDLTLGGKYTEDNGTTWVDIESSSGSGGSGDKKYYRVYIDFMLKDFDGYTTYFTATFISQHNSFIPSNLITNLQDDYGAKYVELTRNTTISDNVIIEKIFQLEASYASICFIKTVVDSSTNTVTKKQMKKMRFNTSGKFDDGTYLTFQYSTKEI